MAIFRPHLFRALVGAAALSVIAAEPVAAMTCTPPDPWFLTTISLVGTPQLPDGLTVRATPRRVKPTRDAPLWDDSVLNWLELQNTNTRPAFVLENADEYQSRMGYEAISWPDEDLGDVPSGFRTSIKLENSIWYSWPTNCAVVRCQSIEWRPATPQLAISDGSFGLSRAFQDLITRHRNRPVDVAVPGPQSGALTLSYDRHAWTVPFVVTYELNRSYNPATGTESSECGSGLVVIAGAFLLLVSAGIAFPIWVLLRSILRLRRRAVPGR
jgi:hypothetical protein